MTADRVSFHNLEALSLGELGQARRALYYPDHIETVSDALGIYLDHVIERYHREKADNPDAFRKGAFLSQQRRHRWAVRLNDARRAWRDLQ